DAKATLTADAAPGAFAHTARPATRGPPVALLLPYGKAMARHSGLVNVDRGKDGVLRDVGLYLQAGDWNIPSLPLRLAALADPPEPPRRQTARQPAVRINWRTRSQ